MSNEELNDKSNKRIQVFVFNDREGEYKELILDGDIPVYDLLNSDNIILFIDHDYSNAWIWQEIGLMRRSRSTKKQ